MHDTLRFTGTVKFDQYDKHNRLINSQTVKNLVVLTGLRHVMGRLGDDDASSEMSEMALGISSVPPQLSHTSLQGLEVDRVSLEVSGGELSESQTSRTYVATFGPGTTGELQEAGIFNDDDVMLCRTVFPPINKGVDDSLVVTWVITAG